MGEISTCCVHAGLLEYEVDRSYQALQVGNETIGRSYLVTESILFSGGHATSRLNDGPNDGERLVDVSFQLLGHWLGGVQFLLL